MLNLILVLFEWPCLCQALLAVRLPAEVAMAIQQVRHLFPLVAASVAALRCVIVISLFDLFSDEKDGLRLIEGVLVITDHEAA